MGARQAQSSGSFGFDYGRAQDIINAAVQRQQEVQKQLESKGTTYIERSEASQKALDELFGRGGAAARQAYEAKYATELPKLTEEYRTRQEQFKPSILNLQDPESSFNLLANVLRGSAKEFATGMDEASTRSSARLYQALAAPAAGFEAIANKPAFNKLYDPTYMELAKKPPTVTSDVDSFKSLYTYNV
jgi:hypothetical protein